ncbi:PP2C family protein-serine/threonine phosphatase [Salidesulfovibrio brasiliensis]|uniref:PP2C family protein-serine/threonine phosphatase n=1 Tax=Salidesulfovibrio brasiliensis TaxID=221711 RepID=UPI0009F82307|nr:SpoIIE family protein phosphatase [Salidesulfovibrio brasiliensis]
MTRSTNDRDRIRELEREVARLRGQLAMHDDSCRTWVDEFREVEARLRLAQAIVDNSPVVLFRRNAEDPPQLEYVSDNIGNYGYEAADFLAGKVSFKDIVHPEDLERFQQKVIRHTEDGDDVYTDEYRILTRSGEERWIADRTVVVRDEEGNRLYHQGILNDITRRKQVEDELRRAEERQRRIIETAAEGFLFMDLDLRILDANRSLLNMLGYTADEVLGRSTYDFAAPGFKRYLYANRDRLIAMEHRTFEGILVARDGREVPVLIHGNILRDENGDPEGHVAFVSDLTGQKKALQLAEEVQQSLLPSSAPEANGLDIAGRSLSSAEVGGDYYDFVQSAEGLNVAVGDISGHGVDAALLMTSARAFLRMRVLTPGTPVRIVREMNRQLSEDLDGTGRFMTFFLIRFEDESRTARWVRAGHDPALVYCPHCERFTELGGSGLPLGVDPDTEFEESDTVIEPGQIIAIGTDGIWEARSPSGELFGKERYRRLLRLHATMSATHIVDAVLEAVDEFTSGIRPDDDVTLVVVKSGERA